MEDPVLFQLNVNLKAENRATCLNLNGEEILNLSPTEIEVLNILSDDEVDKIYKSSKPLDIDNIVKDLCSKYLQDVNTTVIDMITISAFSVAKIIDQNKGLFNRSREKIVRIMEDTLASISDSDDIKTFSEFLLFEKIRDFNYKQYSSDSLVAALVTVVDCFVVMNLFGEASDKKA